MHRKRVAAVLVSAALALAALVVPAGPAQAADNPEVGPIGIPIPGTGCTVYTPWVSVSLRPPGVGMGPWYVECEVPPPVITIAPLPIDH